MENKTVKEIAKEIKNEIQKIKGVKVSASSKDGHLYVSLIEAPFEVIVNNEIVRGRGYQSAEVKSDFTGNYSVNQYHFNSDENLTIDAKILFNLIEEIVKKYHWDKSDSMTDYFHCAFYYSYSVGRYDKPFKVK
jgi:hypothetical protein